MKLHDYLQGAYQSFHQPETQVTVTGTAATTYFLTLNNIIGALTVFLLVGQIGLMIYKWYEIWKKKKSDTKE